VPGQQSIAFSSDSSCVDSEHGGFKKTFGFDISPNSAGGFQFAATAVGGVSPSLELRESDFLVASKNFDRVATTAAYLKAYLPARRFVLTLFTQKNQQGTVTLEARSISQAEVGCDYAWIFQGVRVTQNFLLSICSEDGGLPTAHYFLAPRAQGVVKVQVTPVSALTDVTISIFEYVSGRQLGPSEITLAREPTGVFSATFNSAANAWFHLRLQSRGVVREGSFEVSY